MTAFREGAEVSSYRSAIVADVQKNAFLLSSATLMVAPAFTTDVFTLKPDLHSVGMAREIAISVDSSLIELRNGIAQALVDAKKTNVSAQITGTVYEITAQNLLRAAALDSSQAVQVKRGVLTAAANAAAVSLSINSDPVPGDTNSAITATGDIPSGSTILIQRPGSETDYVFPTLTSGAATGTGPYTVPIAGAYAIPAGMSFPIGSRVWVVTPVAVASMDADQLFGVKIVGTLSNYDRPVTAVFPKVRMSKGFNLSFQESEYGSMPWEMSPLLLSAAEATNRLAEIGTRAPGKVYVGG
jgi:hypothetical protein